ncbi:MAG: hypothetical protein HKN45_04230 [Flavobacteriales bacterium]|nr:hypothetical protein [Flavobacteriales bacterium]
MSYREKDIIERVIKDFGDHHNEVLIRFETMLRKEPYLDHPRYIRCIIHQSQGSLSQLEESIEIAKQDPRDIMLYAEFIELENGNWRRVRNFNNTFERSTEDLENC